MHRICPVSYTHLDVYKRQANIPVIYVDAEDDETVITLGQIFNCNAKADEVAYVKAALEK